MTRWEHDGASLAVIGGRFRVLRSALGWAYTERLLDVEPLRRMRGPGRCALRRSLSENDVRVLLATAELRLLETVAHDTGAPVNRLGRHRAEQDLLLVRLAADTGARRGELAALRLTSLRGTTLHIDRAISGRQLTPPKSGRGRMLTVGTTTATLWHQLVSEWTPQPVTDTEADDPHATLGPWLFSADLDHRHRLGAETLGHRFARLRDEAGVPGATLHRLRHSVATFLVARGQVLQAQARLGHADAATTLREYAYALPLTDQAVAEQIDRRLAQPPDGRAQQARRTT